MSISNAYPRIFPEEAAALVRHGATVAFSGFTQAGTAKAVPRAIAERARSLHAAGEPFKIRVITGGAGGPSLDEVLARAEAISWLVPLQNTPTLRVQINREEVEYMDLHLSAVSRMVRAGFLGKVDLAVIEATDITPEGRVYLSSSIGASPTFLETAEKVIIELNRYHSRRLPEMADILISPPVPHRPPLPIHDPLTKVGYPYAVVDPAKVVGIVETNEPDDIVSAGGGGGAVSRRIAAHVVNFLVEEIHAGHVPGEFLPLQVGVGPVATGVLVALAQNPFIPPFKMYTLSILDAVVDLMEQGKVTAASATSLSVTPDVARRVYDNMDFFAPRIVLRPQEISNDGGVVRRLAVIALNSALEVDIYGNVNASHVYGTDIVNGIGGSGEFTRNSFLSIIMCPSISLGGRISNVVPMCPHIDSNEHSVQVIVTEQGLADLRGLGPMQRAKLIIENCAHPAYREPLHKYIEGSRMGHIRHNLDTCYEWHINLMEQGTMVPGLDVAAFED